MVYIAVAFVAFFIGWVIGHTMGHTDGYSDALLRMDEAMFGKEVRHGTEDRG